MSNLKTILEDQRQEILNTDCNALLNRQEEKKIDLDSKLAQVVIGVRRSGNSMRC